jgi:hypothetical protein
VSSGLGYGGGLRTGIASLAASFSPCAASGSARAHRRAQAGPDFARGYRRALAVECQRAAEALADFKVERGGVQAALRSRIDLSR